MSNFVLGGMKMFCPNCGTQLTSRFCPECGFDTAGSNHPVEQTVQVVVNTSDIRVSPKSKWAAFWLCLLFGYLGIHRFYVGKDGSGIFFLLSFGVFGFGWIIDLIVILCGNFSDKYGRILEK